MSKKLADIPVSILDLAPILEGETPADSFHKSLKLAQIAESLGYKRLWYAEHHNMPNIASSATAVLIGYIANGTSRIRVGSGGIMLPNHAPLIIAEQFGTLASLFPDRIDLGLGRAPGTDNVTSFALRRRRQGSVDDFPEEVIELRNYLWSEDPQARVRATPGTGTRIPLWLLGSSLYSAQLSAMLGLPFSFASHFAPTYLLEALRIHRERFTPSEQLQKPYLMPCVNVMAADTDEEALHLATSFYQMALGIITDDRKPLQPPTDMSKIWSPQQEAAVKQMMTYSFIGSKETIALQLQQFLDETDADEIMVTGYIYDQEAKMKSFKIIAEIFGG